MRWLRSAARAIAALLFAVVVPMPVNAATYTGVLEIVLTLKVNSTVISDGTVLSVTVSTSVSNSSDTNANSVHGTLTASNGQATGTIDLYYTWVASSTDKVTVTVSVYGANSGANGSYEDAANFSTKIAVPANGATTKVAFTNSL